MAIPTLLLPSRLLVSLSSLRPNEITIRNRTLDQYDYAFKKTPVYRIYDGAQTREMQSDPFTQHVKEVAVSFLKSFHYEDDPNVQSLIQMVSDFLTADQKLREELKQKMIAQNPHIQAMQAPMEHYLTAALDLSVAFHRNDVRRISGNPTLLEHIGPVTNTAIDLGQRLDDVIRFYAETQRANRFGKNMIIHSPHLIPLINAVAEYGFAINVNEIAASALLHDTREDGGENIKTAYPDYMFNAEEQRIISDFIEFIIQKTLPFIPVQENVEDLTKNPNNPQLSEFENRMQQTDYMVEKMKIMRPEAMLVKVADVLHNSDEASDRAEELYPLLFQRYERLIAIVINHRVFVRGTSDAYAIEQEVRKWIDFYKQEITSAHFTSIYTSHGTKRGTKPLSKEKMLQRLALIEEFCSWYDALGLEIIEDGKGSNRHLYNSRLLRHMFLLTYPRSMQNLTQEMVRVMQKPKAERTEEENQILQLALHYI
ncbi:hypothetical protein KC726_02030 [Candidatus Woesebacteria bacterium]|nr:hypothetical protein [Candidatus Woesebacteria bacterium]